MTRREENERVIDDMAKRAALKPTGTYEEMVAFQLGAISTMLTDIAKSLAIIADGDKDEPKFIVKSDGTIEQIKSKYPLEVFNDLERD